MLELRQAKKRAIKRHLLHALDRAVQRNSSEWSSHTIFFS